MLMMVANKEKNDMSNLTHLFKVGQKVKVVFEDSKFNGIVKETFVDHIIIDVESVSDHCWFDEDMLDMVYPICG